MTTIIPTGLSEESEAQDVSEAVAQIYEKLPEDFREQWEATQGHDPRVLAERVARDFDNHPDERREILCVYLAQRLGYWWSFNRRETLLERPLWDLLDADVYAKLGPDDIEILFLIATSSRKVRPALEPRAALAAVVLWRNGDQETHRRANEILAARPLPSDMDWLFELVRVLAKRTLDLQAKSQRRLFDLLWLQHLAGFNGVVGAAIGLYFARRYGSVFDGTRKPNIIRACDRAAADYSPRMLPWLRLVADATIAGQLKSAWLEPLLAAAIRHESDDGRRQIYQAYHRVRPYRVSSARVAELYAGPLILVRQGDTHAGAALLYSVDLMWDTNPVRAKDLLELLIAETGRSRGDRGARLTRVLEAVEDVDPLIERLVALYVITFDLRQTAIQLTSRLQDRVDWSKYGLSDVDVEIYLVAADYDRPLRGQIIRYAGVDIEHVDKDAAALVHYFRTKRNQVNTLTGIVQNFATPKDWLATHFGNSDFVDDLFHRTMLAFEKYSRNHSQEQRVVTLLRVAGQVDEVDDIPNLPARSVLRVAQLARHKALLSSALVGAVAGGLAPATSGVSAVLDAPLIMALTAEVCAATCWYFGFDPADDPELPIKILAIALAGSATDSFEPHQVHRQLHSFLVRKSLIIAAIGQGAYRSVLSPTLASGIDVLRQRTGKMASKGRLLRMIRRDAEGEWSRRLAHTANLYALPVVEGGVGATLNLALMYDICESAQAVLTDRFLARKYPGWERTW